MTQIFMKVSGTEATAKIVGPLTAGSVGAKVKICFDKSWDGLIKTLVCKSCISYLNSEEIRTLVNVGEDAIVAHEVMIPGRTLYLGLEGRSADGTRVVPTVWADCGVIQHGASADADPSAEATPEVWAQMLMQMGSLDALRTDSKDTLVAAINEAMTKGDGKPGRGITSVHGNADGSWTFVYDDGISETVSNEAYMALVAQMDNVALDVAHKEQLKPEFANSIEECTDTTKLYVLPDGNIYAYMSHTGLPYENQIPHSVETDGTPYNGGKGFKTGYRLNSSGVEAEAAGCAVTGFIPVKYGDVVRFKNFAFTPGGAGTGAYVAIYDSSFNKLAVVNPSGFEDNGYLFRPYAVDAETGYLSSVTMQNEYEPSYGYAYMRISAVGLDGTTIVTVNEEIVDEEIVISAWANTGHAFVPADYEDRIIKAETDISVLQKAIAGDLAVYGIVDGENNILMTGTLMPGKYTLKYMAEDGTTTDIGEFTME